MGRPYRAARGATAMSWSYYVLAFTVAALVLVGRYIVKGKP